MSLLFLRAISMALSNVNESVSAELTPMRSLLGIGEAGNARLGCTGSGSGVGVGVCAAALAASASISTGAANEILRANGLNQIDKWINDIGLSRLLRSTIGLLRSKDGKEFLCTAGY